MAKWAIIRPDSQSGHSPSNRYDTESQAIAIAKEILSSNDKPMVLEVVKITCRVTTKAEPKVMRRW